MGATLSASLLLLNNSFLAAFMNNNEGKGSLKKVRKTSNRCNE